MIQNYLHDIRNKMTLIKYQVEKISKSNNTIDFKPILSNVNRVNDLVNLSYKATIADALSAVHGIKRSDFATMILETTVNLASLYGISIESETQYGTNQDVVYFINENLLSQVIDNILDNSFKAKADKIKLIFLADEYFFKVEFLDNGTENTNILYDYQENSYLPHGLGTKIICNNMHDMNAKVEWNRKGKTLGTSVCLFFPHGNA